MQRPKTIVFSPSVLFCVVTSGAVATTLGDVDHDGDIDHADSAVLFVCFGGSGQSASPACPVDPGAFDLDDDGDIDLDDYALFVDCVGGPGAPIPPTCALPFNLEVEIQGPGALEDGRSGQLAAVVTGAAGPVEYLWEVTFGKAAFDDPTREDPTVWMTGAQDVTVRVTATDPGVVSAIAEHVIAAEPEGTYSFRVYVGDDHPVDWWEIELEGAYFDPLGCQEYRNYWDWMLVSAPPGAEGWFNKPHRLGTPANPVRYTLLEYLQGDYVFALFGYSPCSQDEDYDTIVIHVEIPGFCQTDADCDDGDLCTVDYCFDEFCENEPADCDDGDPCTDDWCDPDTGECINENLDCDDGLFCNGIDTCDTETGECVAGTRPCDDNNGAGCDDPDGLATEECTEGDTAAVCTTCLDPDIFFTLSQDNLTGTTGDDTFWAPLEFNIQSGTQIATLQTGDSANGLAGDDILNASFNTAGTVVPQSIAGIETISITNFAAGTVTLSSTNVSGVDTITSSTSVDDLAITGLQELTDCGFKDINDTTVDLALTFAQTSSTSGAADAFTCTLENATVGTLTVTTNAANGFETMNLVSNGTVDNRLTTLTQTTGNTMATAVLTGAADLRLDTMPATVLTYNASAMTGGLQLGSGTDDTTYAEFATAALTQLTGGSGDDLFIFEDTLTSADFSTSGETLDCRGGTDVVQNSFAATLGAASKLRNCEEVRFNASASSVSVNFSGHTGLDTITIEEDGTASAFSLLNVQATGGVFPTLNFRGDGIQAAQMYDTITYAAVGATGSSDSLAITVGNRRTALNAGTATTNVHTIGGAALTAAGFEVATIDVTDGPATFNGLTALALTTLTITGSSNVTMGTVSPIAATGIVQLDASAVTGNFSVTIADLASGGVVTTAGGNDTVTITAGSPGTSSSITLGGGNDTFTGDATTDSADTIDAGAGNDTIHPGDGADTVTTGSGSDTVVWDQAQNVLDQNDVSDFTAGTGGDIMKFDTTALGLAGGTEFVGALAGLAADGSDEIAVLTGVAYARDDLAAAAVNGRVTTDGVDMVIIYFNTATTSTHIIHETDAGAGGTVTLLGNLTNITTQATHNTLTAVNIDSQS